MSIVRVTQDDLVRDGRPVCGAACAYGGVSMTRKYANTDLGFYGYCNRAVRVAGDRCWQHRDAG